MNTLASGTISRGVAARDRVVGEVEPGREVETLAGRTPIGRSEIGGVPDGTVGADLRFVVAAGVLAVGQRGPPAGHCRLDVVADRQPRHDAVRVTLTMSPVEIALTFS